MEDELFLNAVIPRPMPAWPSLTPAMEVRIPADQSVDCFFNWDKSTEQSLQFDSALSSMVSSPAASNSNLPNDSFVIRELIGKLGSIGNSGEISPHSQPFDQTTPLTSTLTELSADPGFADRAARFSCFSSRSFNGRMSQNAGNPYALNPNPSAGSGKLPRVSSNPSINATPLTQRWQLANSHDQSAISDSNPIGDSGFNLPATELGSRKRKATPKGKSKETATKVSEANEESNPKRSKPNEGDNITNEKDHVKGEDEEEEKQNSKPPEPPKDYIHVRARRGQATDSHSLAERVRREKISERMKLLQDLVPGCNKVTGKALMLDEIINYVQSLQRQVEFLSMKLASVDTRLDFNTDSLIPKDMVQQNSCLLPLDSSVSAFFGHQPHQKPALQSNISSVDHSFIHLPSLQHFTANLPQTFCEGDLQTIVQMGLGQNPNPNPNPELMQSETHNFHGLNQASHMKVEL